MPYANIEDYRAYQRIYQREWSRRNRDKRLQYERSYVERHPEQTRRKNIRHVQKWPKKKWATNTLQRNVRLGRVKRLPCENCGDLDSHGHHEDYSKPLEVRWLCRKHHLELHRKYK